MANISNYVPQTATADVDDTSAPSASNAAAHDNAGSAMLRLPPELRNIIYSYCDWPSFATPRTSGAGFEWRPPSLLQVCRQTRSDTIAIYYSTCSFTAGLDENLVRWLKTIGPQARPLVRSIKLTSGRSWSALASQRSQLLNRMQRIYAAFRSEEDTALRPGTLRALVFFPSGLYDTQEETLNEVEIAADVAPHKDGCDGIWCVLHGCR